MRHYFTPWTVPAMESSAKPVLPLAPMNDIVFRLGAIQSDVELFSAQPPSKGASTWQNHL
jgi:hypothetical protein